MAGASLLLSALPLILLAASAGCQEASGCDQMSPVVIGERAGYVLLEPVMCCLAELSSVCVYTVPGILGSQMEARLAKANHTPHWFCRKDSDWFTMWLSIEQLLPEFVDCFSDNARCGGVAPLLCITPTLPSLA